MQNSKNTFSSILYPAYGCKGREARRRVEREGEREIERKRKGLCREERETEISISYINLLQSQVFLKILTGGEGLRPK